MAKTTSYLDPTVLASLGNMELVARCAVEGLFTGVHPSPFHGFSVEYSDHRDYHPGDELKFLVLFSSVSGRFGREGTSSSKALSPTWEP